GVLGDAGGAHLHPGRRARDLLDLEALVGVTDEQLDLGPPGDRRVAHRDSTSSPVASSPHLVISATSSPEVRSRSMNTCTRPWKKAAAARGLTWMSPLRLSRSRASRSVSVSAWIVADRGDRSNRLISPKKSPGPKRARICSTLPFTALETTIEPSRTRNISSPWSPSRKRI